MDLLVWLEASALQAVDPTSEPRDAVDLAPSIPYELTVRVATFADRQMPSQVAEVRLRAGDWRLATLMAAEGQMEVDELRSASDALDLSAEKLRTLARIDVRYLPSRAAQLIPAVVASKK